jgi:hypothetical protein
MNKDFNNTLNKLTEWVKDLMQMAKNDESFLVSWFGETKDAPFCIVGGWSSGFSEDYADTLFISKSNPEYAMCIKIIKNEGPYGYCDYESLNVPVAKDGEDDDTCIALELEDDPASTALFYLTEWERITKEYGEAED